MLRFILTKKVIALAFLFLITTQSQATLKNCDHCDVWQALSEGDFENFSAKGVKALFDRNGWQIEQRSSSHSKRGQSPF